MQAGGHLTRRNFTCLDFRPARQYPGYRKAEFDIEVSHIHIVVSGKGWANRLFTQFAQVLSNLAIPCLKHLGQILNCGPGANRQCF